MQVPLRVAIVGCGKIADGHVEEIAKLPTRAVVVAVCDREPLMAEQLASRYGIPRHYGDFDALLARERPDVVHVATPPAPHAALALQAIEAGCHVYVEKPFALNADEARRILDRAQATRRKVTVGWSSYFDPPALALRALIADGALGTPVHVESYYGYNLAGPFGQALLSDGGHWVHRLPGKLLHNIIDHMLNKIAEFVPDDEPTVHAVGNVLRPERLGDARDEMHDELRVIVQGRRVSGYGTFTSHVRPMAQFVRVYGTKNIAHVDYVARTVTFQSAPTLPSAIGRLIPGLEQGLSYLREGGRNIVRFVKSDFHFFAGLRRHLELFYDCIGDDGPPPIPYRDIVRISSMMDTIFRQVKAGGAR